MGQSRNIKQNLLKGFACISVVFGHVTFPGLFGQIVLRSSGYTVPIFFMIAGYYAFGKGQETIKRRLFNIVKIFICAYALHFLYNFAIAILTHRAGIWLVSNFNWKTPIKYICFCTIDFAIPLWYLIAMIEVYILWLIIVKNGKEEAAVKTIPVLFLLLILLTTYCETKNLPWFWKINFITRGMPWFLLGYYLHSPKAETIKNIHSHKLWALAITGCIITVIPTAFDLPIKFNVAGNIPYAFGLFVLTLKNPGQSIWKLMEYIGEHLSLYIYILHTLIAKTLNFALGKLNFDTNNMVYLWFRPIIVVIISIFVSWIIYSGARNINKRAD